MFKRMLEDDIFTSTITFNAEINCYWKERWVASAFIHLSKIEKRNLKLNMQTYNELIKGLCRIHMPHKEEGLVGHFITDVRGHMGTQPNRKLSFF